MSDSQEQLVALEQVAAPGPHSFVDGPFGSEMKSSEYSERGVRLIQLQNIGDGYWIDNNKKFIPLEKFETLKRHGAVPGNIVIAKMADPVARSCILPAVTDQFIVVADCIKLTPDPERFDARFVSAAINSHRTRREAETKSSGTTRLRINLSALKTVHIWAPQLAEQRQIACILDTVDEAIAKTDAVIVKLKQVRAGLRHDLLTRGLDEHGQLRDPIAHPEQFKDSPLGRIPKDWKVMRLGSCAQFVTSGSRGWASYYSDEGALFLRIGNLTREHIDLRLEDLVRVRPPTGSEGARTRVQPGDVLISITADLGIIGVIPEPFEDAYVNQHIALVRPEPAVCSRWIGRYLSFGSTAKFFRMLNDTGAKAGMNLPSIESLLLAIPSREEQHRATAILDSMDADIAEQRRLATKLQHLKSGLMADLLTGRVRVPEEVAVAS